MVRRLLSVLAIVGLFLACAGMEFHYKFYSPALPSYEGTLRGPEPEDNVSFKRCEPTASDMSPCLVIEREEAMKLKERYLALISRVEELEKQVQHCQQ